MMKKDHIHQISITVAHTGEKPCKKRRHLFGLMAVELIVHPQLSQFFCGYCEADANDRVAWQRMLLTSAWPES